MSSPESNHTRGRLPSPGGIGFEMSEMGLADLDEILAIEERSFVTPWSRKLFMEEYHSDRAKTFVARTAAGARQEIAGYLCAWFVEDEVHILNLACHPRFRRRNVATGLLEHCLAHAGWRAVYARDGLSPYHRIGNAPLVTVCIVLIIMGWLAGRREGGRPHAATDRNPVQSQ